MSDAEDLGGSLARRSNSSYSLQTVEDLPSSESVKVQQDKVRKMYSQTSAGLQIRGSKFQSSNSNFRELELTNLLGLVLGCIEAKFCK